MMEIVTLSHDRLSTIRVRNPVDNQRMTSWRAHPAGLGARWTDFGQQRARFPLFWPGEPPGNLWNPRGTRWFPGLNGPGYRGGQLV